MLCTPKVKQTFGVHSTRTGLIPFRLRALLSLLQYQSILPKHDERIRYIFLLKNSFKHLTGLTNDGIIYTVPLMVRHFSCTKTNKDTYKYVSINPAGFWLYEQPKKIK